MGRYDRGMTAIELLIVLALLVVVLGVPTIAVVLVRQGRRKV
ncbi:MAG: prepilin-type N-terminal cleavage/methylation domain-containing protein [Rhodoglobus sp.]